MARLRRPSGVSGWARTMRASIAGVIGVACRDGRMPRRRRMPSISSAMLG
jgi:hypothetical protein